MKITNCEPIVAEILVALFLKSTTVITTVSELFAIPGLLVENWEIDD